MNIIVNCGTRGIGKEVVAFLAHDINNQIIVTGRSEKSLTDLSANFKNVKSFAIDMALFESQGKKFIDFVSSGLKKVDILINIAGTLINKDFLETSLAEGKLIMETNFFGPAALIGALKPLMAINSHIVNISSMGGFQGSVKYRGLSYYSASKAALACLTECLANEFTKYRISVNCLALGAVQTEMLNEAFPGYKAPVEPKDIAEFIAGFALRGHKFFNGKILPVAIGNP
jgi:3-oxoacyl-[acyl-carrier protein] reductase